MSDPHAVPRGAARGGLLALGAPGDAEPRQAHPVAVVPAALVSIAAVLLFGFLQHVPGYLLLVAGVLGAVWTDRTGRSFRLAGDLAAIGVALMLISTISLKADISWLAIVRFTVVLSGAVVIPYVISRFVYRQHAVRFPWGGGRWTRVMWIYLIVAIVAAYLILPVYFLTSGVYRNWPTVVEWHEIARLFAGVNAVGLWDELFFICIVFTLLLRHFPFWIANLLQATIFVSFLWELGYQEWGPLLTIPFALVQGMIFNLTKNLAYVVTVHLLFDAIVFLVIVHAHHPAALPIFPLIHGW